MRESSHDAEESPLSEAPQRSTPEAEDRPGRRLWRVLVPLGFLVLIVLSILFIASFSYRSNRAAVLGLSDDLLIAIEQRIATEVRAYLKPAATNAELAARLGAADALQMEPGSRFDDFALEVLRQHPQLAMLNAGDEQGEFMMPKKMPDGSIDTKLIERAAGEPTPSVRWIRRNPAGEIVDIEPMEYDGYDPRTRPWYIGAKEAGGLYWTQIYIFFTDRRPGITAAYPVIDDRGETLGVLGVDIELDNLCDFLAGLEIGETGRAMIIDGDGTLIAYPQMERISKVEGETIRPVRVDELGDAVLTRAFSRFMIEQHGRREINVDGEQYITTVTPLDAAGHDWSVMIVVPERDFTSLLRANNRTTLAMSTVIVVLGLILAGMLAAQSIRADRSEARVRRRRRDLEARSHAFSGMIAGLADLNRDPAELLREMTELACEGLDVRRISVWRHDVAAESLRCLDAFERGAGHSDGSELKSAEYPHVFAALAEAEATEVSHADQRFPVLTQNYLDPLQTESLLMVPVSTNGEVRVWVWFERVAGDPPITDDRRAFADAIAGLLAMGCGEVRRPASSREPAAQATAPAPAGVEAAPARRDEGDIASTRAEPTALISAPASELKLEPAPSVTVHLEVAVMAMKIGEPNLLLAPDASAGRPLSAAIAERIGQAVSEGEVTHWMAAGSTICCVKLTEQAEDSAEAQSRSASEGVDALARLAMDLRDDLADRLALQPEQTPAKFAIELGAVGMLPTDERVAELRIAGPAIAGAVALAESAPAGAIQVSAAAEQAMEANFVCRERGPFFVEGVGELQTFVLVGRLRR